MLIEKLIINKMPTSLKNYYMVEQRSHQTVGSTNDKNRNPTIHTINFHPAA